jgi:outer membrane usher protein
VAARDQRWSRLAALAGVVLIGCGVPGHAMADAPTLLLEVVINGRSTGKVVAFEDRDGALYARREDLIELGLRVPKSAPATPDGLIALAALTGLTARLDAPTQTLDVTANADQLAPALLGPASAPAPSVPVRSGLGLTLNYDLAAEVAGGHGSGSGLFDLRAFSPAGVLSADALAYAGAGPAGRGGQVIRLDASYVYSDYDRQRRYWLGDVITGGLTWTRPVRMGGAQVTRDFTMRPDLVTFPVPTLAGSVAVPSTVDVLVNGSKALSSQVEAGPFAVPQLPVVTGAGLVQLTVTNALGQQVTTTLPFYASASLLAPGLHTWSMEAGFVRRDFGTVSNDYGDFAASGTYRRGLTPDVTVEAHAEGTTGQFMAGGGIVANAFNLAELHVDVAGSTSSGRAGGELAIGVERVSRIFSFGASAVLATRDFRDIAAMNGDPAPTRQLTANVAAYLGRWGSVGLAYVEVERPPALVPVGVTGPPAFVPPGGPQPPSGVAAGAGSLAFLPAESAQVMSANYSAQFRGVFFYATGFHDFARGGGSGVTVGITIPLGRRSSVSASGSAQPGGPAYGQIQAQQSAVSIGDWGYQVYLGAGAGDHEFAQAQYKSPWLLITAGVDHLDRATTGRLDLQGALTLADGGLFASNTINDSFAVVDTGGVGRVRVLYENRPAGETDASGRLLAPDLRAWDVNRIAIDPADVPIDAQVPYTEQLVRPPDRSGVVVKFPIRRTNGALLILVDASGQPLPVGSTATLQTTGVVAPVGYDGQAFVEGLTRDNTVIVQLPNDGRCVVHFSYAPAKGQLPKIGPLTCRPDDR